MKKNIIKKEKKSEQLKQSPASDTSVNYFVDTFNSIDGWLHKGLWILAIEYTYSGIKQSLNHCTKKINPNGYNDLYTLKSHFFNHVIDNATNNIYIGTNHTYMYDLIHTTYTLLLDYFTNSNKHTLVAERVIVENLAYDIRRTLQDGDNNYRLHAIYCNLYHKIYHYGYNELSILQYNIVKKVRSNYRMKDDIISRISSKRRLMLGFEVNLNESIKQLNNTSDLDLNILIKDINKILKDVKPVYKKVLKMKLQGLTFSEISNKLGYTNESGSRKIYNKAIALLRSQLNISDYNTYNSLNIYNLTTTIDID